MEYLEHHFPLYTHAARPTKLGGDIRTKLDSFLPLYRKTLEKTVENKGREKANYRFLRPHHLAIVSMKSKFILALDTRNAVLFATGLYYFELKQDFEINSVARILEEVYYMKDCYFFEFDKSLLDEDLPNRKQLIAQKAVQYEEMEYKLIKKGARALRLAPKVFKNTDIVIKENYCFVLMPFEEELKEIYEDSIRLAFEEIGFNCERADDIFHNTSIMEVIWTKICSAEIIVADLTGKNPNVFYEIGIAHTLGKEVILITQNKEDVPFDLRHLKYIKYSITRRGQEQLKEELKITVQAIKGNLGDISNHRV
ncbi:MAG: hypothetical protein PHO47_07765 [Firmicutes bacterium]|nr:hypothetical protein [Bacillota bacterium]